MQRKMEETDTVMAEVDTVSQQYLPLSTSCSAMYSTSHWSLLIKYVACDSHVIYFTFLLHVHLLLLFSLFSLFLPFLRFISYTSILCSSSLIYSRMFSLLILTSRDSQTILRDLRSLHRICSRFVYYNCTVYL